MISSERPILPACLSYYKLTCWSGSTQTVCLFGGVVLYIVFLNFLFSLLLRNLVQVFKSVTVDILKCWRNQSLKKKSQCPFPRNSNLHHPKVHCRVITPRNIFVTQVLWTCLSTCLLVFVFTDCIVVLILNTSQFFLCVFLCAWCLCGWF